MGASPRSSWPCSSSRSRSCAPARARPFRPSPPDSSRLAVAPLYLLLPLLTASLLAAAQALAAFGAASTSPENTLATLLVEPPPSLAAISHGDGTIDLEWPASPTAASRAVEYVVLSRPTGASDFSETARTSALFHTDSPPPGSYDYVVRATVSTFVSADSAIATATVGP